MQNYFESESVLIYDLTNWGIWVDHGIIDDVRDAMIGM